MTFYRTLPSVGEKQFDINFRSIPISLQAIKRISFSHLIGSDYDFWRLNYYIYGYKSLSKKFVLGMRFDGQQSLGDAPFYLLPYIDTRGIPIEKYQGRADVLAEMETRWDVVERWSAVAFGGTGKAFDKWSEFKNSAWIFSYGAEFRYLIARKFKLRVGIDVAHGRGTWAYYIIFGSNWLK